MNTNMGYLLGTCLLLTAGLGADAAAVTTKPPVMDSKILGGSAIDIKTAPWQVTLRNKGVPYCGASIISNDWVVTTASCLGYPMVDTTIRAGSTSSSCGGTVYNISQMIKHDKFSWLPALDYDIAVIKVSKPFVYKASLKNIELASQGEAPGLGLQSTMSGWGRLSETVVSNPEQLRAATIPVLSQAVCIETFKGMTTISDRTICAGSTTAGACLGDGGGPLTAMMGGVRKLIGIISIAKNCIKANPGVFTRVPILRAWITEKTGV